MQQGFATPKQYRLYSRENATTQREHVAGLALRVLKRLIIHGYLQARAIRVIRL